MSDMTPYTSISLNMPQYTLIFSLLLNMAEYCWMSRNMSENVWINCSDYARVLNIPRYSYNIIINVANIIMLEFLSTWFVHPGAPLPSDLF